MFNFIVRMFKRFFPPSRKQQTIVIQKIINNAEEKKPSLAYNILAIGGLVLLLLGMSYGGIYGAFFLDKMHKTQDIHFKNAVGYTAKGKAEEADYEYDEVKTIDSFMEAITSSHSHLALFGLITLSLACNITNIRLDEKWKVTSAIALLVGGLLFPVGVILQPSISKTKSSGKDYYWLKGLALAGFMLLLGMGLVQSVLKIVPQLKSDSLTTLAHIISYVIYGLVSSYVIAKYGKFTIIKEQ